MRLTRVCATIGPASREPAILARLIEAGVDVVRLNFSHGEVTEHAAAAAAVRTAADRAGRTVGVLVDLQGPRIRLGRLPAGEVTLEIGQGVALVAGRLRSGPAQGAGRRLLLPVTHDIHRQGVRKGHRVLLRDGSVCLRVVTAGKAGLSCRVERGGAVGSGSGMNLPDSRIDVPALTTRDRRHLQAGVEMGADAIALSFVRDAADIQRARRLLKRAGRELLVVAKIERREALDNLARIVESADGVIVARGDLGVECSLEEVPLLQKQIIRQSIQAGCFVMTATQMLESMIDRSRPTRAEVSDVANAVLDGSDAVMLSGETAVGRHPVAAVAAMDRIARRVEAECRVPVSREIPAGAPPDDFVPALARSAVELADHSRARALVAFTWSGRMAQCLAAQRPTVPIHAFTPDPATSRRIIFHRGIDSRSVAKTRTREEMFDRGVATLREEGQVQPGDVLVLVGGFWEGHGVANTLKVMRVEG